MAKDCISFVRFLSFSLSRTTTKKISTQFHKTRHRKFQFNWSVLLAYALQFHWRVYQCFFLLCFCCKRSHKFKIVRRKFTRFFFPKSRLNKSIFVVKENGSISPCYVEYHWIFATRKTYKANKRPRQRERKTAFHHVIYRVWLKVASIFFFRSFLSLSPLVHVYI